ncbi:MAG: PRC-barrel domain-containing protein [Xanthobacteraceae bacterium]|nr:PRC-barrel domain-containing protein [Xanthobacteraceae bacterium]
MIAKSVMTVLLGSTLLATAALAQSPSTSTTTPPPAEKMAPAGTTTTTSHQGQWRASKVVNLKIYNDGNESLGTVNDLLMDNQGRITTAVIGVGGFLGMGEHYVAVPFEKIKWVDTPAPSASASGTTGRPSTTTSTGAGTTTGAATTTTTTATPLAKPNPWYPDHGVLSVTKDELKAMPEFKYST